jgi:hypothetical protein
VYITPFTDKEILMQKLFSSMRVTVHKNVLPLLLVMSCAISLHAKNSVSEGLNALAVGGVAYKGASYLVEHSLNGILQLIDPHQAEFGVTVKELRKEIPKRTYEDLKKWLAQKQEEQAEKLPKSWKGYAIKAIGHRGFEKLADVPDDLGLPLLTKDNKTVRIPYLKATSPFHLESDAGKKIVPFINLAVFTAAVWSTNGLGALLKGR